jgi:beta-lactamase regulating signal transducer with metallopeptidase domain
VIAGICSWKIRNVAIRHAVWVIVLGVVLLMPAVDYLLPASWVPARIQRIASEQPVTLRIPSTRAAAVPQIPEPPTATVTLSNRPSFVNLWNLAATLYALVAFAMFVRLALGYRKIWKLRRSGRMIASPIWKEIVASRQTRWRLPVLLESKAVQVPMTVGLVRPAVILPPDWKNWDDWKMRAVLLHEIAHIRRNDWGIAVIAAAAKCAYWLNPLSWFLERKLSQLAEQACDDATLSDTQNPTRYAEILLEFAVAGQNGGRLLKGGVAMSQPNMKARIERTLGNPKTGTGIVKVAGWALMMFLAVPIMYSAAALQVKSENVKAPLPAYVAELGRNPVSQTLPAGPQAAPSPAPASGTKLKQISPNTAADPPISYDHWEAEYQRVRRSLEVTEQTFQMLQKYNESIAVTSPESPNSIDKSAKSEFLQYRSQLGVLQAEVGVRERQVAQLRQQIGSQPNPNQSQLDQLRGDEEALKRYNAEISRITKLIEEKQLTGPSSQVVDSTSKYRVYVTGRVQKPGDIPYDKPLMVLQALALAGGFQEYAKRDAISIIRMNGNSSTLFRFNYSEVISGVNSSQNIYLENGDVVVVP